MPALLVWSRAVLILAVAGHWILQLTGHRDLQNQDDLVDFWFGVSVHGLATLAYLILCLGAVRGTYRPGFAEALGLAVVLRLLVLPLQPALSDDVYRYMHEGHMVLVGENPYLTPPAAVPEDLRLDTFEKINNKDVPAAYPPAAQYAMAVGYALHPTPLGMKIVFGLCDLLVFVALWSWLPMIGLRSCRAIIHGFCPLMVLEFAGEGHGDSLAVLCLVLCLIGYGHGKKHVSSGFLAIATAVKVMPLVFLPFVARQAWFSVIAFAVVLLGLYAPFVFDAAIVSGERSVFDLFDGSLRYADAWRHNDSVFHALHKLVEVCLQLLNEWTGEVLPISYYPHNVAKVPIALIGGVILLLGWLRKWPVHKVMAGFFMYFVACTPTLHPWYLAFLVPFLCIYPAIGSLVFTGTIYIAHIIPGWGSVEIDDVKIIEYLPFYIGFFTIVKDESPGSRTDREATG